jgi:hypothetical protein
VNLFVRPGESPIGHKAKLCDPSFHSDFKLQELQENLDRINQPEAGKPARQKRASPPQGRWASRINMIAFFETPPLHCSLSALNSQKATTLKIRFTKPTFQGIHVP